MALENDENKRRHVGSRGCDKAVARRKAQAQRSRSIRDFFNKDEAQNVPPLAEATYSAADAPGGCMSAARHGASSGDDQDAAGPPSRSTCSGFRLDPEESGYAKDTPWHHVFSLPTILEGAPGARVVVHERDCDGRCQQTLANSRGVRNALAWARNPEKDMDRCNYVCLSRAQIEERLRCRTVAVRSNRQAAKRARGSVRRVATSQQLALQSMKDALCSDDQLQWMRRIAAS